jgi:hypothetical protein
MTTPRHLVTVWNPLYAREVEQHLAVLLHLARLCDDGKARDDDLYVWWGKVKSPNRQQPLVRAPDIRALGSDLANGTRETEAHLYVTDYRVLFVGELLAIHEGDLPAGENEHVPPYYAARKSRCDFWVKRYGTHWSSPSNRRSRMRSAPSATIAPIRDATSVP